MMTVLSGFLLLLCASVCQALLSHTPLYSIPLRILFRSKSRNVPLPGYRADCFKNMSGIYLSHWQRTAHLTRVDRIEDCNMACNQRKDCDVFLFVKGFGERSGCKIYQGFVVAEIKPTESRSVNCRFKHCTKRGFTYDRRHLISLKEEVGSIAAVVGVSEEKCHARCKNHTGKNGFLFKDVQWGRTYHGLQQNFPNKRVPCNFITLFYGTAHVRSCYFYAKGAKLQHITRIAGLTPKCKTAREEEMKKQLNDSSYKDYKLRVLQKKEKLAHYPEVLYPKQCSRECYHNFAECAQFLVVHGMLENSGCWLFTSQAQSEYAVVRSGPASCTSTACLTKDFAYGSTFEIVLKKEYELKGNGLSRCQQFCAAHSVKYSGFAYHEVDWDKTGVAINPDNHTHECVGYTYGFTSWFERKCRLFGGKDAIQLKIVKIYGTVP